MLGTASLSSPTSWGLGPHQYLFGDNSVLNCLTSWSSWKGFHSFFFLSLSHCPDITIPVDCAYNTNLLTYSLSLSLSLSLLFSPHFPSTSLSPLLTNLPLLSLPVWFQQQWKRWGCPWRLPMPPPAAPVEPHWASQTELSADCDWPPPCSSRQCWPPVPEGVLPLTVSMNHYRDKSRDSERERERERGEREREERKEERERVRESKRDRQTDRQQTDREIWEMARAVLQPGWNCRNHKAYYTVEELDQWPENWFKEWMCVCVCACV